MQDITVGLVQMQALVGQLDKNLAKIEAYAAQGAAQHVDILCFPELSITGYDIHQSACYAQKIGEACTERLLEMACRYQLTLLAGMAEAAPVGKPYITFLLAQPNGQLESYRKTHLGTYEKLCFQPGEALLVKSLPKAQIAPVLCWEMHFPELVTALALKGAEIIFAPHASPTVVGDRRELWMRYMPARAYDNSAFVAVCNLIGANGLGVQFGGGLLVLDPKGRVMAEDFSGKESLLTVKLPAKEINRIRHQERTTMRDTFYLSERRPELYGLK